MQDLIKMVIGLGLVAYVLFYDGEGGILPNPPSVKTIEVDGNAALVLTETGSDSAVSAPAWSSPGTQSTLDSLQFEWRMWDDDLTQQDMAFVSEPWKKAYAKAVADSGGERPWLLVSGKGGQSVKLPTDPAAVQELLKKYGGSK